MCKEAANKIDQRAASRLSGAAVLGDVIYQISFL